MIRRKGERSEVGDAGGGKGRDPTDWTRDNTGFEWVSRETMVGYVGFVEDIIVFCHVF